MLSKVSNKISAISLLLLCLQTAANSKLCSEGECPADDSVFGQENDLSLVQMTAIEKRAQEGSDGQKQKLDAAIKRKKDSKQEKSTGAVLNDKHAKAESKDTSKHESKAESKVAVKHEHVLKDDSKAKSKDTSKAESKGKSEDKSEKNEEHSQPTKRDPWAFAGDGCCDGPRELRNGKLFGGRVANLQACKNKCRSFRNCGAIEFGWHDDPHWCFAWNVEQTCEVKDAQCKKSVIGNGNGAKVYRFFAPDVDYESAKQTKWDIVGPGCCDGLRDESNGKLFASKEPTLDACKARCLSFENCGVIEYGWQTGDPEWCFIWDDRQKCEKQDLECKQTLMGSGRGATAHKLLRAEE
mmetsp:Transcript_27172/g.49486  ORF Transcript_27172/g.49486 Transcript_27172/m.49486 type:complete len:353 (+) Transcript_27172:83-1141(+)